MNLQNDSHCPELLYVSFNQDYGCFACGTESGFIIFNCEPQKERFRRDFKAGIGIVEMLFRCNILALVGGGSNPKFPPNKVIIWDDYLNKAMVELDFLSNVKAVKLRRDTIVVAVEDKYKVYNFADLQLQSQYETCKNKNGLLLLSPNETFVLAAPAPQTGHVQVKYGSQTNIIKAHNGEITQMALTFSGNMLATSSEKGTIIRIWDVKKCEKICEFRRGRNPTEIYSLCFSPSTKYLAVTSAKGTVHIYSISSAKALEQEQKDNNNNSASASSEEPQNRKSSFAFMSSLHPYFNSEWSFATFTLPEMRSIICFSSEETSVIALTADGSYYQYALDTDKGGDCKQKRYEKFMVKQDK